jgi:hypothetical protein
MPKPLQPSPFKPDITPIYSHTCTCTCTHILFKGVWQRYLIKYKIILLDIVHCLSHIILHANKTMDNFKQNNFTINDKSHRHVPITHTHLFFYCASTHQSIHSHIVLLPNTPWPLSSLWVSGRIPIWVIDHYPVSSCQVFSLAAPTSTSQCFLNCTSTCWHILSWFHRNSQLPQKTQPH